MTASSQSQGIPVDDGMPGVGRFLRPLVLAAARINAGVHAKLLTGFLVGALLLLALGALSLTTINEMDARVNDMSIQQNKALRAGQMLYDVTSQMHYRAMAIIAGDTEANGKITVAKRDLLSNLRVVERESGPGQRQFFRRVQNDNATFNAASARVETLYHAHRLKAALKLHLALEHPLSHVLEAEMRQLIAVSGAQVAQAWGAFTGAKNFVKFGVLDFAILSVLVALILGFILSWAIILPVRKINLLMPEMDGFEFATLLHQRDKWRSIPVVVITSRDLSLDERRQLESHVAVVLQKGTYTREELLAETRRLVGDAPVEAGAKV